MQRPLRSQALALNLEWSFFFFPFNIITKGLLKLASLCELILKFEEGQKSLSSVFLSEWLDKKS